MEGAGQCNSRCATLPDGIEARIDIPYIEDGHRGHLLDVYYPKDAGQKLPVIIDIHGGGFLYGDKDLNKLYGYHLAKKVSLYSI